MAGAGLEGLVVSTSEISNVYGDEGRLIYRGFDIHDLAEHATFEETVYLLWYGYLPTEAQLDGLKKQLRSNRAVPEPVLDMIRTFPKNADPMDALRTSASALGMFDPDKDDTSREANERRAVRLTAQLPTLVAAFERARQGKDIVAPKSDTSLASNFLYMMTGKDPDPFVAKVFDVALVLHADHEFNASTFSSRVTVATLADMYSGVVSAIGTLSGPLHGGANAEVMRMLLEIGEPENVESFIGDALESKKKIMGFGHRVYRTLDPRAVHLRQMSRELGERAENTKWVDMSEKLMDVMHREKPTLNPNVDFFSASAYYTMNIPLDQFTPIFAISRVSGWTAHILEQYANNRLIRPRAQYTGLLDQQYTPIAERTGTAPDNPNRSDEVTE